jgi:hypothetical protein
LTADYAAKDALATEPGCKVCVAGQYMHSSAAAVCISCEPGQYQDGANVIDVNNDNMHSASWCKKCPIGWSTKDQTEVKKLPGALENPNKHLKSTCVRCLRGKHTNGESGAAQCDVCPPGSFGKLMTQIDSPGFSCVKWYVIYLLVYIFFETT